jgi:hypothetical protein
MKGPRPPQPRDASLRQDLAALLRGEVLSARDISRRLRIPEKGVYDHLAHLRRSLSRERAGLQVQPARCLDCDFVFRKRDRLTPPGRCPLCRSETVAPPLFTIPAPESPGGRGHEAEPPAASDGSPDHTPPGGRDAPGKEPTP